MPLHRRNHWTKSYTGSPSRYQSREATHPENPYLEIKYIESPLTTVTTSQERTVDSQIVKEQATWIPVMLIVIITVLALLTGITLRRKKIDKEPRSVSKKRDNVPGSTKPDPIKGERHLAQFAQRI